MAKPSDVTARSIMNGLMNGRWVTAAEMPKPINRSPVSVPTRSAATAKAEIGR
jgi:hypothetical protein